METFTKPQPHIDVIGTKLASELSPGDKVYFKGAGLVKTVHSADHHAQLVISDATEDDRGLVYGKGVLVRWDPPHNKINWYTAKDTELVIAA